MNATMYTLRHGLGPGTLPRDVDIKTNFIHPDNKWWDVVVLDRELTQEEMMFYDIHHYEHRDGYSRFELV